MSKHIWALSLALLFVLSSARVKPAYAQTPNSAATTQDDDSPDCDVPQFAYLEIVATGQKAASLSLTVCVERSRTPSPLKLLAVLPCPDNQTRLSQFQDRGLDGLEATCVFSFERKGLQYTREIDAQRVLTFVKSLGIENLSVRTWINGATAQCNPAIAREVHTTPNGMMCEYTLNGRNGEPSLISFSFGYGPTFTARLASILGFLLLMPIALALWFRRRALNTPEEAKPTVVFAYVRFIKWTVLGGALVWWAAIDLLRADEFVQFLLPHRPDSDVFFSILAWILLWIPPAIVYFICLALSSPIHALRGVNRTQSQVLNQSFWAVARFVLPISFLVLGIAELYSSPRIGVLLLGAWVFTARLANRKLLKSYGMELHALTSGELRDKAFEIAGRAGAKLNQLYVLPAEQFRMANAFAHIAQNIFLTDYLLKNLSKREVDAIVAHEVGHLQKRHHRTRALAAFVTALVIGFLVAFSERWIPAALPAGPLFFGFILAVILFVARRNEFEADAAASKLTGDAAAMISALAKVSRLNTMPVSWSKLDEKVLTHPSTMRRINALARVGNISEARIPDLLAQAAAAPEDTYQVPPTALRAGKLFSTQFKARASWVYSWALLLSTAVLPAIFAVAIDWSRLSGWGLWLALVTGLASTIGCSLVISSFLAFTGNRKLVPRLREKLEKDDASSGVRGGLLVSLAPDSEPRTYENNWTWDLGLLAVSEDQLCYWGEESRFALRRDQITSIALGPGPVNWFNTPALYVHWRSSDGAQQVLNFRSYDVPSLLQMARKTRRLAADLENWYRGLSPQPDSSLVATAENFADAEPLGPPAFGQVTSASPRMVVHGNMLSRVFLFNTFVAVGVAVLFGLRVPMINQIVPLSAPLDLSSSGAGALYVLATMWITRAFELWPFWRFRDSASRPAPQPSPIPARQT